MIQLTAERRVRLATPVAALPVILGFRPIASPYILDTYWQLTVGIALERLLRA